MNFKTLAMASTFCMGAVVSAQADEALVETYNALKQLADVCVTDPCPVEAFQKEFMNSNFDGVRLTLPNGKNYEIMTTADRYAVIWICERENYVEPDAFSCVSL